MGIDFRFYLNRQGIQGKRGERGEQGFSPLISVKTQTANEYILTVQNEDGSFDTPNLRGNAIANNGGTYIRYNPLTQEMYTGDADYATNEQAGVVLLSTYAQLEAGGSEGLIPTSADVYDLIQAQMSSIGQGYVTQTEFDTYTAATALTLNGITGDISALDTSKMSFTDLVSSLVAGNNITLTADEENKTITIDAAGGDLTNYVTLDTAQTITGGKTFKTPALTTLIRDSGFYFEQNAYTGRLSIGANVYGGVKRGGIIASQGLGAIIGTSGENSSCIYLPPNCKNPLIIKGAYEPWSSSDVDNGYPIWNESIVNAGSNITISVNGSGRNKTYTISATSPDLSNYMTLDTAQTVTQSKTFDGFGELHFTRGSNGIYFEDAQAPSLERIRIFGRSHSAGVSYDDLTLKSYMDIQFELSGNGGTTRLSDIKSAMTLANSAVQQADIQNMQTTTNLVTSVDSSSTDSQYPSAKLFYDTVGDIETLINAL